MTAIRDLGELGALNEERVAQLFESERRHADNIARQRATAAHNRMISEIAALPPEIREKLAEYDGRVCCCDGDTIIPWENYRQTLIADGVLAVKPTKAERQAARMAKKATKKPNKPHKRVCPNCGRKMTQQFIGLKHCKCGMSWSRQNGYFERSSDMVFCLEKRWVGKKKKNLPVVRFR
ncbi:hypothetical protein FACS1894184_09140 [Clostridia bacterium]|nr:hypothetical protein FACS1894184_09140 [Clostridia bacterium]